MSLTLTGASQAFQAAFLVSAAVARARFGASLGGAMPAVPLCVLGALFAIGSIAEDRVGATSLVAAISSAALWLIMIGLH
ncbi:MAG TPA: hypothetical protein VGS20_10585 [Candidatus Acidoferrales bacterium]|nr:hypothetical protein [Candidatus Acidoferrales bacterium]